MQPEYTPRAEPSSLSKICHGAHKPTVRQLTNDALLNLMHYTPQAISYCFVCSIESNIPYRGFFLDIEQLKQGNTGAYACSSRLWCIRYLHGTQFWSASHRATREGRPDCLDHRGILCMHVHSLYRIDMRRINRYYWRLQGSSTSRFAHQQSTRKLAWRRRPRTVLTSWCTVANDSNSIRPGTCTEPSSHTWPCSCRPQDCTCSC
jgi:hypothetical protein